MTLWAELNLDALTPGESVTAANTDNFFDLGYPSTETYWIAAAVTGGGIGIHPRANGGANAAKSLAGHSDKGRIGWKVEFLSVGAGTSYFENFMLRTGNVSGGTIIFDVGLRNASGRRELGARNSFSYIGQANGNPMSANEQWSIELYWDGLQATVYVWDGPGSSGAPAYTWGPATMSDVPGNLLFGPDSGDTVDAILYDVWITDGERREPIPIPGDLLWLGNWDARHDRVQVVGKVTDAEEVTLDINGLEISVTPDVNNYFRIDATGLSADTAHPWEILVDGASRLTGSIKTLPAPGSSGTHRTIIGSCLDSYSSPVFGKLAARNADLIFWGGDRDYTFIQGGPNGSISPTTADALRPLREKFYATTAGRAQLDYAFPMAYIYSDCDGAGGNADGTTGGNATGVVQEVWRQQTAVVDLPVSGVGCRSWVIGPFRYVLTDETTAASLKTATDNSSKTKLGAPQLAWFLNELEEAAVAKQAVIWLGDGPFHPPTVSSGTSNEWTRYNTERMVIVAKIEETGVRILRANGDRHSDAADDGTNNPFGGFPTVNGAPFHTTANPYGMAASSGSWPLEQTNGSQQYVVLDLDHDTMQVTANGYSSTNAAPTEVQRFDPVPVFDLSYPDEPAGYHFIEWNGTTEAMLGAIEWDGSVEAQLSILEQA